MAKAFVTGVGGVEKQSVELKVSQNGKYRIVPDTGIVFDEVSAEVDVGSIRMLVVTELPTENIEEDVIYLLPSGSSEEGNVYDEYVYTNGAWEMIGGGGINVDLTDYVKKLEPNANTFIGGGTMSGGTGSVYNGILYGVKYDGTQGSVPLANQSHPYSVPFRDNGMNFYVGDPTQALHCVNKRYAEENYISKITTTESANVKRVYGIDANGNQVIYNVLQGQGANFIVMSDPYGCIYAAAPRRDGHCATKGYVDNAIAAITNGEEEEY